jgi:hypothetical protein
VFWWRRLNLCDGGCFEREVGIVLKEFCDFFDEGERLCLC